MKIVPVTANTTIINETKKGIATIAPKADKITPRKLPNCIGAADENYGAKWIVSQEQKDKIREFWEQVPQALKDAIKQLH